MLFFMYYSIISSFKVSPKQLPGQFQTQIVFQVPSYGSSVLVNSLTCVTSLLPNIHPLSRWYLTVLETILLSYVSNKSIRAGIIYVTEIGREVGENLNALRAD